jgi:hypothetical protein
MIEAIKMRGDAKQRKMAIELEKQSVRFREERQDASPPTSYMAAPLVAADVQPQIDREVYDCEQRATLPGKRVRSEVREIPQREISRWMKRSKVQATPTGCTWRSINETQLTEMV